MGYMCMKPAGSCKTCEHHRPDEDDPSRLVCWAQYDEKHGLPHKKMIEKMVIIQYQDGGIVEILHVHNWDEAFAAALTEAETSWGGCDDFFDNHINTKLKEAGYSFDIIDADSYTTYQSDL